MCLAVRPLLYVQSAYNKVRIPGIIQLISGFVNLIFAIIVARWGKWGVVGVAIVGAVVWTIKNTIFVPIYTAYIMNQKWWTFVPSLVGSLLGTLIVGAASYIATLLYMPHDWLGLGVLVILVSLLYGIGVMVIGFNRADWKLIRDILPGWIKYVVPG